MAQLYNKFDIVSLYLIIKPNYIQEVAKLELFNIVPWAIILTYLVCNLQFLLQLQKKKKNSLYQNLSIRSTKLNTL